MSDSLPGRSREADLERLADDFLNRNLLDGLPLWWDVPKILGLQEPSEGWELDQEAYFASLSDGLWAYIRARWNARKGDT